MYIRTPDKPVVVLQCPYQMDKPAQSFQR